MPIHWCSCWACWSATEHVRLGAGNADLSRGGGHRHAQGLRRTLRTGARPVAGGAAERAYLRVLQCAAKSSEAVVLGWQRTMGLRQLTVFTLHLFLFQRSMLRSGLHTCRAIYQPIPSAAMFQGYVRAQKLIELPSVGVV